MTNLLLHIGGTLPTAEDVNAVHALAGEEHASLAPALIDAAPCSVLVWKHRRQAGASALAE